MKKHITFCLFGILGILFNSCKNDLDSLAPYSESIVVYSLIDQTDTANYVRVNRVFLGEGDATQVAQIKDSVYFKPGEANVSIEKYWNGNKRQTYIFSETYEKPLVAGAFNVDQLIYKSKQKFKSDSSGKFFEYKLIVKNNLSGKIYNSKNIKLVKDINTTNPSANLCTPIINDCFFSSFRNVTIPISTESKIFFATPINAKICDASMNFHYQTIYLDNSQSSEKFTYVLGSKNTVTASGGENMDFSFVGSGFYLALANSVTNPSNLKERVADSISYVFTFAGEEYVFYKEINNTSGSFGMDKPIYTNMENGAIGLFSSRTKVTVNKKMWDCGGNATQFNAVAEATKNNLTNYSVVCHLRFRGPGCATNSGC